MVRLRRLMPLLVALFAEVACARLPSPSAHESVPSGPALIVIAPQPIPPQDQASEAYADWAGYLNDFAAAKPSALRLIRMTPAQWKRLVRYPLAQERYASAFVGRDGSALLYKGMILEPYVYIQGVAWVTSGGRGLASIEGFTRIRIAPIPRTPTPKKAH